MSFKVEAVDEATKAYWRLLFREYGESLVKDIPRRIKAELAKTVKVASADDSFEVVPTGTAKIGSAMHLEGMYKDASTHLLFSAVVNEDGSITEIKTIDLK